MPVAGAAAFVALAVLVEQGDETVAAPSGPAAVLRGAGIRVHGCGAYALADAGATGTVGPSLDSAKPSASLVADRVRNGQGAMPSFAGS